MQKYLKALKEYMFYSAAESEILQVGGFNAKLFWKKTFTSSCDAAKVIVEYRVLTSLFIFPLLIVVSEYIEFVACEASEKRP